MDGTELARMFADMATAIDAKPSVEEALAETVDLATQAVGVAEMAGVSWLVKGSPIETTFASHATVKELDSIQFDIGQGPAVDATREGSIAVIDDTRLDETYPKFSAAASARGVLSAMSCQLSSPRRAIGALNFYATQAGAFDEGCREVAQIYAAQASIVLANRSLEGDLRTAIDTRGTIGQAMGILIERHKVAPDAAFDMLVRASQHTHTKLRELAQFVVDTGVDPKSL